MIRTAFHAALAVLLMLAAGCRDSGSGDYLALSGKLFIFNYRVATATYVVTLAKIRPIPEGARVVAEFEDPAGGEALRIEQKVWPAFDKISLESPPLSCVVKGKPYRFTVTLVAADSSVMQRVESTLASTLDQSVLPDKPLVVGPVYTPNPELAGHPDGKLPGLVRKPCPSG